MAKFDVSALTLNPTETQEVSQIITEIAFIDGSLTDNYDVRTGISHDMAITFLANMDNVPDDIIDQYEFFKEHSRKTNTPMRLPEDGILAALVAKYIRQIENDETSYPSMIKKYKFKNYPPQPLKSIFVDYLKEISREHSLTGVTDALSNISKYINDTIKE